MSLDRRAGLNTAEFLARPTSGGHDMGNLIYSPIASLDGYVEDAQGKFDWAAPDEEVHSFVNDRERGIGTYLYGRRMYETMRFWETRTDQRDASPTSRE